VTLQVDSFAALTQPARRLRAERLEQLLRPAGDVQPPEPGYRGADQPTARALALPDERQCLVQPVIVRWDDLLRCADGQGLRADRQRDIAPS